MFEERFKIMEDELRAAGLSDDAISKLEIITTKKPTVLPVVKEVGKRIHRVTAKEKEKLKKASSILKKIATDLGKEQARLQEIYKIKEKYNLDSDKDNISEELASRLFNLLQSGNFDRAKLSEAANLLIRLDQTKKLINTLDLEIENRRVAIAKLKEQMAENGVTNEDKYSFNVRTKISRLRERYTFSKIAKKLKKEAEFRIKANQHDDQLTDSILKKAFFSGKSLQESLESISDKSFEELQADLVDASHEYNEITKDAMAYRRENHHYSEEILKSQRDAWSKYANAFWLSIVKAQELERLEHYEQINEAFKKYGVKKEDDGTIICVVGDETIEVKKRDYLSDSEKLLAAAIKYEASPKNLDDAPAADLEEEKKPTAIDLTSLPEIDIENTTSKETEPENTDDISLNADETEKISDLSKELDEMFEDKPALKEEILEPVAVSKANDEVVSSKQLNTEKVIDGDANSFNNPIDELENENNKIRDRLEEIKENNNKFREEQRKQAEFYGANWSDMEINPEHTFNIKDENGNEEKLTYIVKEREELENQLKNNQNKIDEIRAEKREERKAANQEKMAKAAQQINKSGELDQARKFFANVENSVGNVGYDLFGLDDDAIIQLFNKYKNTDYYKKTVEKMLANPEQANYNLEQANIANDFVRKTQEENMTSRGMSEEEALNEAISAWRNVNKSSVQQEKVSTEEEVEMQAAIDEEMDKQINDIADEQKPVQASEPISESAYEALLESSVNNYKKEGLSVAGAEQEAIKQFHQKYPGVALPARYADKENTSALNGDMSGFDVLVSDVDQYFDNTEQIGASQRRR